MTVGLKDLIVNLEKLKEKFQHKISSLTHYREPHLTTHYLLKISFYIRQGLLDQLAYDPSSD